MSDLQFPPVEPDILILENADEGSQMHELIFHVESGDYFAMLSTLLGFVEETASKLQEQDEAMKIAEMQIARLRANLKYLQDNYTITPKKKSLETEPKLID